ncbi:hypothetical protein E7V67_022640 [[Empedobacter] haloabium]|uniref:Uncharacterized protein n=1 Tax=[Empedobacter] haloabium TaxID=592317 RepID=A0ABZ1UIY1_9BURK
MTELIAEYRDFRLAGKYQTKVACFGTAATRMRQHINALPRLLTVLGI